MKIFIRNEAGFTLIELIVSMVVGAILVAAITPILRSSVTSYETATSITESNQASRIAYNRLLSELRMIPATTNVTAITSSSITFTDRNGNTVTYAKSGTNLLRNGYTFVKGVTAFTITPKDNTGSALTPTAQDSNVWTYEVNMTVSVNVGNTAKSLSFQGEVAPRNY